MQLMMKGLDLPQAGARKRRPKLLPALLSVVLAAALCPIPSGAAEAAGSPGNLQAAAQAAAAPDGPGRVGATGADAGGFRPEGQASLAPQASGGLAAVQAGSGSWQAWKQVGSGTQAFASFPSGFDAGNSLYGLYAKPEPQASDARVLGERHRKSWVYWHWTFRDTVGDSPNIFIENRNCVSDGLEYRYFDAFESATDYRLAYPADGGYGDVFEAWRNNAGDASQWWFRLPVYEQAYTDYGWAQEAVEVTLSQTSYVGDGSPKTPGVKVTSGGKELVGGVDYTVAYANNTDPGTASAIITGAGAGYRGSVAAAFEIEDPAAAAQAAFDAGALEPPGDQAYTGAAVKPAVKFVVGGATLVQGTDYRLSYENNTDVGTAVVVVVGIGAYAGAQRTCEFRIVPKAIALKKLEAKVSDKAFVASWDAAPAASCSGYEVRYGTRSDLAGAEVKKVAGRASTSCTVGGLAVATVYYVEVRVYVEVDGAVWCSSWSRPKSVKTKTFGSVSGVVTSASSGAVIPGAWVYAYTKAGKYACRVKTDASGCYGIANLAPGAYKLKVKKGGYRTLVILITVKVNATTYCDNARLAKSYSGKGRATGTISSATTGLGVGGVVLEFRKGWNQKSGAVAGRCKTNASGFYSVRLPAGYYTACLKRSGYVTIYINVVVGKGTISGQGGAISPKAGSGSYRAVLTWGRLPYDLDAHLVSTGAGGTSHVCYRSKDGYVGGKRVANLDVDDVTSYGPETVTFKVNKTRTYVFYVQQYSNPSRGGRLATSSAKVRLYKGNVLLRTYSARSTGYGRCWNVFKIANGKVQDVQTISDYPEGVSRSTGLEGRPSW